LYPEAASAYLGRGIAYKRNGEYNSAIADLSRAIQLYFDQNSKFKYNWPKYADWYLYRGQTYQAMGLKNEALADFQKVLELAKKPEWVQAAKQGIQDLRN
jgi:tetratricopeptide (TPR) repeat protein